MSGGSGKCIRRSGFTLVEVVIALALIVIVLGGAYSLVIHAARVSRMARDHYIAVNLAKNRIERARNFRYADLYLLAESNQVMDENGGPSDSGRFRRTTAVDSVSRPGMTVVTVTVRVRSLRTGAFGNEGESMSTMLTDYMTL